MALPSSASSCRMTRRETWNTTPSVSRPSPPRNTALFPSPRTVSGEACEPGQAQKDSETGTT